MIIQLGLLLLSTIVTVVSEYRKRGKVFQRDDEYQQKNPERISLEISPKIKNDFMKTQRGFTGEQTALYNELKRITERNNLERDRKYKGNVYLEQWKEKK